MTPAALIAAITAITTTVIAQSDLKVSTLQFPKATRVVSAYCADLDLDGRTDLVITTETDGHRELRTLLRRPIPPCFAGEPTVLRIDKDVVAFAFVDVLSRKGCELVVFTPSAPSPCCRARTTRRFLSRCLPTASCGLQQRRTRSQQCSRWCATSMATASPTSRCRTRRRTHPAATPQRERHHVCRQRHDHTAGFSPAACGQTRPQQHARRTK